MLNWNVSSLFDDEVKVPDLPAAAVPVEARLPGPAAAFRETNAGPLPTPQAAHLFSASGGLPARPVVDSLRQAGERPVIRDGSVAPAPSSRTPAGGKVLNIGEQHIHFENPPENRDDFAAMVWN